LFTITVTDLQTSAQLSRTTDVTETQIASTITVTGLPLDADLSVVVTAQAWVFGLTNYLASDSSPVTVQAKGSVSGFQTPTWLDQTLGSFSVGQAYSDGVQAQSDAPITYVVVDGALPDGITLDSTTGTLTGSPTTAGYYSFAISAQTLPTNIQVGFSGNVSTWRGCEDYSNALFASNILLNPDGTPIGCDYDNQAADLRPQGWEATFGQSYGAGSGSLAKYQTRLGWACDDCTIGASSNPYEPNALGIPIGFDINFFGTTYSELVVNSNGSVSFGKGSWYYNQPLNSVLNGAPGIAPYAVDLDNRDVTDLNQSWGAGSSRHADFFYWGRTTYEGKQAFVVTWMNSQIFSASVLKDFNTLQLIIVDNGSGDADYVINYGSLQDLHHNAGYRSNCDYMNMSWQDCPVYLAAGFGSSTPNGTLYASLQDQTGYLYNGAVTSTAVDGGENALSSSSLNSDVPGRFIYHMVSGYVPEVATVPSAPLNLSATNLNASVTATWEVPSRQGGAPITGYVLRYRLAGTSDAYIERTASSLSAVINGLEGGNYSLQVAAVNEIGRGPFSRSFLISVAGPVYANLTAYHEALAYSQGLNSSFFTPESWADLVAATSVSITRTNTQAEVDAQTLLINTALSGLVLVSTPVFAVNYNDYNAAVLFANSLHQADFTTSSWANLVTALAVDVSTADQQTVDNQTALINAALNALVLEFAGQTIQMSDLTAYNAAVSSAAALREVGYSTSSWAALQAALSVTITRDNLQADIDNQTALIIAAIAALQPVADLSGYNQALADAAQYAQATVTAESWTVLQLAIAVVVNTLSPQADVDAATARINAAIDALVFTANMTAYNAAVAQALALSAESYTTSSWAALQASLAIQVSPLTDSQVFVDIATANITSAIAALVVQTPSSPHRVTYVLSGGSGSAPIRADTAPAASFTVASAPSRTGYGFDGWSDGTTTYQAGDTYVMGATNVVFTAQWTALAHVIAYSLNGGEGSVPLQGDKVTDSSFIVAAAPVRAGYTFGGWTDGAAVYQAGSTYSVAAVNVTFTATWSPNATRSITFTAGGGSGSGPASMPSTMLAGQSFQLPVNPFTRVGFDFAGWSDGTSLLQAGHTMLVAATDMSFAAVWTENVVTVSHGRHKAVAPGFKFEKSDISVSMFAKIRLWVRSHMNVTSVTCTGYTGWNQSNMTTQQLSKLGKARANAVCNYIKKLNPAVVISSITAIHSNSKNAAIRRVVIIGTY
jgi:uncharacterized repeat protein (TIGR02543 family)